MTQDKQARPRGRRLWDNEDNARLVYDHYPWHARQHCGSATLTCRQALALNQARQHACRFRDVYDALPRAVMKADACRYLYMHHVGGAPTLCAACRHHITVP
jgi:mannosyltransferase OCH1-like enzyme